MKKICTFLLTVSIVLLACQSYAQVPQKINYQEMYIRKSMLGHGLYTFIVRRKGKIYKKSIWLD
jgi:hypothetical protein